MNVKICGITEPVALDAAVSAGARYIGLVFFEKSPRNITIAAARQLALRVPDGVAKVALTVNADDAVLDAIIHEVPLDFLQLHGQESPARMAQLRTRYGLPLIKAVGVATVDDLPDLVSYGSVSDMLLVDAKPAKGAALPGGNGLAFDWRLIAGRRWPVPWMLAGGLTADTVAQAVRLTGATQVDVSSGVETAPGVKDPDMIRAFIAAANG